MAFDAGGLHGEEGECSCNRSSYWKEEVEEVSPFLTENARAYRDRFLITSGGHGKGVTKIVVSLFM